MELGRSIDLNKSKFEESNIGVVENLDSVFCGYRFINDNRTKEFMGVMTDIDLALEAEKFFAEETK